MSLRNLLRVSLVLFLFFPFLFLFSQFQLSKWPEAGELWWAFKNSTTQAFFSALLSLTLGFWTALGLLSLQRSRRAWELLCLIPNFLPPLFVLLAILNIVEPFPMGLPGVIFILTLMNFGLAAVMIARLIEEKAGPMVELAWVEGASRFQFVLRGLVPLLRKDLALLGLFIFVICFGSFAVPLVVGGGRGTTIEVLIYEKIRLSHEWGEAVLLAFMQSLFIFVLSFVASQGKSPGLLRSANLSLIKVPSGLLVVAAISCVYIAGYIQGLWLGFSDINFLWQAREDLLISFVGSLVIGFAVGSFCYLGLMLIAYCYPKPWFENFLSGYVAPSTSLACFSLLIVTPNEGVYPYIKIPIAITLLNLNGLFRMGWHESLQSLHSQLTVAYAMGASRQQIFTEITFPQISARAGMLAGIASIWACGDFAVSRILAHKDLSLAMMTETLMSSYRLNQAIVLSLGIVLSGLICFFVFMGGSRVIRRKFTP